MRERIAGSVGVQACVNAYGLSHSLSRMSHAVLQMVALLRVSMALRGICAVCMHPWWVCLHVYFCVCMCTCDVAGLGWPGEALPLWCMQKFVCLCKGVCVSVCLCVCVSACLRHV